MPDTTDDYTLNDDGTITFSFNGLTRVFKRPTLGEYRRLVEALGAMKDTDEVGSVVKVQLDEMLKWLENCFTTLAGEGLPKTQIDGEDVIDEDKIPVWLTGSELVTDLIRHWQMIPNRRGGR